jgi:rod shape-determining protein MreC
LYLPDLFWKYRRPLILFILLGISCLFMIDSLHARWVERAGDKLILNAAYPVQIISESAKDGGRNAVLAVPDFFTNRAQNKALRKRVGELEQEVVALREQMIRERRMGDLLEFAEKIEGEKLNARVIGANPTVWFSIAIVDMGVFDGVRQFMPAVSSSGLAGYVLEADDPTSKVMLLTDPRCKVSVVTQRSRARGVVQGSETGQCLLKYVESTADVKEGDVLITSGNSEIFPEGLLVGRIGSLESRPGDLFQRAEVVLATDFKRLEELAIILTPPRGKRDFEEAGPKPGMLSPPPVEE